MTDKLRNQLDSGYQGCVEKRVSRPNMNRKAGLSTEQTTAIVLRAVEFSETSLIVTLLTKDLGQISAIAKGARRPKGPFEGSLDLLAVCRVVVIRKNRHARPSPQKPNCIDASEGADRSLERLYAGYYVAEMLRLLLVDEARIRRFTT